MSENDEFPSLFPLVKAWLPALSQLHLDPASTAMLKALPPDGEVVGVLFDRQDVRKPLHLSAIITDSSIVTDAGSGQEIFPHSIVTACTASNRAVTLMLNVDHSPPAGSRRVIPCVTKEQAWWAAREILGRRDELLQPEPATPASHSPSQTFVESTETPPRAKDASTHSGASPVVHDKKFAKDQRKLMLARLNEIRHQAKSNGESIADSLFGDASTALVERGVSPADLVGLISGGLVKATLWVLTTTSIIEVKFDGKVSVQERPYTGIGEPFPIKRDLGREIAFFGCRGAVFSMKGQFDDAFVSRTLHRLSTTRVSSRIPGEPYVVASVRLDQVMKVSGVPDVQLSSSAYLDVYSDHVQIGGIDVDGYKIPLQDVLALRVTGPGRTTEGGGFIGGGFGVDGIAIGIAAASLLNALTSSTEIVTLVELTASTVEFVGRNSRYEPQFVDAALAPAFVHLRTARGTIEQKQSGVGSTPSVEPSSTSMSLVESIERLAGLRNNGDITEEEFQALKERLLSQ